MEDLALAGQKVVLDIEPQHGFEMPPQHRGRNQFGDFSCLVASLLNFMQGGVPQLLACFVFCVGARRVPLRGVRVEVPAIKIDALPTTCGGANCACGAILKAAGCFARFDKGSNLSDRFLFDVQEPDNHIRHLNAGVVDVVLHVDLLSGGAQQAHKRIAEDCVAQMPDVCGLVGIDAGVLHQYVATCGGANFSGICDGANAGCAIEPRVDVARARGFESGETLYRTQRRDDLLRDDLGRLAERASQLQSDRRGQFAELQVRRNLQRNVLRFEVVLRFENTAQVLSEPLLQFEIHVGNASEILDLQGPVYQDEVKGPLNWMP